MGSTQQPTQPPTLTKSTRICIKNVPLLFSENQLREHIQNCGKTSMMITDCKILKTKTGQNRRIAFVGFKTQEMASHAVQYFDKSFALTSKLSVELAFTKKAQPSVEKLKPWSRHAKGKLQQDTDVGTKEKNKTSKVMDDDNTQPTVSKDDNITNRQKVEYLSSIAVKTRPKFWTNDDADWIVKDDNRKEEKEESTTNISLDESTSSTSDAEESYEHQPDSRSSKSLTIADAEKSMLNQPKKMIASDLDFLRSKIVKDFDDREDDEKEVEDEDCDHEGKEEDSDDDSSSVPSSSSDEDEEEEDDDFKHVTKLDSPDDNYETETTIMKPATSQGPQELSSTRLFIRNLPFSANEDELRKAFQPYGTIVECMIPLDNTHRNFGYGFIQFEQPDDASKALTEMDGSDFQGRLLHVLSARVRESDSATKAAMEGGKTGTSTYKDDQEKARQNNATNSSAGWSTSFIRGDAVVDNLADRLGVQKGDILAVKDGLSAGHAAIRLALGETRILEENREFFKTHGVDMDLVHSKRLGSEDKASTDSIRRSSTMILVKNLPYNTTLEEITKTFHHPMGATPKQVLMPPSKTFALVLYEQSYIAKKAFKALAYKRFKNVPLYLEWAPLLPPTTTQREATQEGSIPKPAAELTNPSSTESKTAELDEDTAMGASNTLFIKNLNFATTEADLKELFERVAGKVRAVRIPMKALATKKAVKASSSSQENTPSTQQLSMGYGFVEFSSSEAALKAMKTLQGHMLQGHLLEIKESSADSGAITPISNKPNGNGKHKKLMIRNVPFEASRGELLQLFGSFGQLKNVRLPKKFDGGHRGFAFVEFLSSDEARTAMESLMGTHLYGRHLVVEYATEDKEDVDNLRQKAQQQQETIRTVAKVEASRKRKKDLKDSNKD